jgi:C4-type Zn-finger protein
MLGLAILTLALIAGAALYWKSLIDFVKKSIEKIIRVTQKVVEGFKTFTVRLVDGFKNLAKSYSKNKLTDEWEETVTKKSVDERDIPKEIKDRIYNRINIEIDTSQMLLAQLQH